MTGIFGNAFGNNPFSNMMSGFQQAQLNQQPLAIKNSSLSIPQPAQQIMNSPADLQD